MAAIGVVVGACAGAALGGSFVVPGTMASVSSAGPATGGGCAAAANSNSIAWISSTVGGATVPISRGGAAAACTFAAATTLSALAADVASTGRSQADFSEGGELPIACRSTEAANLQ